MNATFAVSTLALLLLGPPCSLGQAGSATASNDNPNAPERSTDNPVKSGQQFVNLPSVAIGPSASLRKSITASGKLVYYFRENYFNLAAITAPAFRAGIRMANPPVSGALQYPSEWRQGAEAFGRNYGDAVAQRVSTRTARALTGIVTREDPRYFRSSSQNVFSRGFDALSFTVIDRSNSGRPTLAISNIAGAAAGGFVGNAYLPDGFNTVNQAGRRAGIEFGAMAGGNLLREFAPQIPRPIRELLMLIGR